MLKAVLTGLGVFLICGGGLVLFACLKVAQRSDENMERMDKGDDRG